MTPSPADAFLVNLAEEYLALVGMTDAGAGDPDDRSHAASARAVVHDQILQALGLTRADDFDPIAWARALLARHPTTQDLYADLPFETNQPLERYRLYHDMRLADFVRFVGVPEEVYLRLVASDRDIPPAVTCAIADRLEVPPGLVNECTPSPGAAQLARVRDAITRADQEGWYELDESTGQTTGPILYPVPDPQPPRPLVPEAELRLADALTRLVKIHADRSDPDYPALRGYLETRIRNTLHMAPGVSFDAEAWAAGVLKDEG